MKIYDSRLKEKVEFEPLKEGEISMYVCGPTVYDFGHLGHGRSAVAFDVMRRYFIYSGMKMTYVSNFTDIDDKMIKRADEEGVSVAELAERIIPYYEEDYGRLNVMAPDKAPLATESVEEMIFIIEKLEEKGLAYVLDDGVYFDVSGYESYGELSGQSLEELQVGKRIEVKDDKRTPYDFVLWKFKKEGEPSWESPWGEGRPGWHIECSAMTYKHLGESFDIHGGGRDLCFPHHECEIAQTKAVFGKDSFAQYWAHNGFITVDNEKMSKSLNNFFTLREIFEKYDPLVVRFMFLQAHYRKPINFSDEGLKHAEGGLAKMHNFVNALRKVSVEEGESYGEAIEVCRKQFVEAMDNDFDATGALGQVFGLVKKVDLSAISADGAEELIKFIEEIDEVFACLLPEEEEALSEELMTLIKEREKARAERDFAESDRLRDLLKEKGVLVEDSANGTTWKRV